MSNTVPAVLLLCITTLFFIHQVHSDAIGKVNEAIAAHGNLQSLNTVEMIGTQAVYMPQQGFAPYTNYLIEPARSSKIWFDFTRGNLTARADYLCNAFFAPGSFIPTKVFIANLRGYVNASFIGFDPFGIRDHPMEPFITALTLRDWTRFSPKFLIEVRDYSAASPSSLSDAGDIIVNGVTYPAVNFTSALNFTYTLLFNNFTKMLDRVRILDTDPVYGDQNYDIVFRSYTNISGVYIASNVTYEWWNFVLVKYIFSNITTNVSLPFTWFDFPAFNGGVLPPARPVHYQPYVQLANMQPYVLLGLPLAVIFTNLTSNVTLITAGNYNQLLVEMKDGLVLMETPLDSTDGVLAEIRRRFPTKPVKYFVISHHHADHCGSLRWWLYQFPNATVVVGAEAAQFFTDVLTTFPHNLDRDPLSTISGFTPHIQTVNNASDFTITDSNGGKFMAIKLTNDFHALSMIFGYVPGSEVVMVSDTYSPPFPPISNIYVSPFVEQLNKHHVPTTAIIVGGHGSIIPFSGLLAYMNASSTTTSGIATSSGTTGIATSSGTTGAATTSGTTTASGGTTTTTGSGSTSSAASSTGGTTNNNESGAPSLSMTPLAFVTCVVTIVVTAFI